ncbi:MAG TPA: RluA family pseudouridine synthase [Firmicutes bacterium]|nr:RluA family pseudouridine synthase [Bacillota bacterium]
MESQGLNQERRVLELVVEEKAAGGRLDRYLTEKAAGPSRSYLSKLIDGGLVLVNGRQVKAGYSIRAGDKIRVEIPPPQPLEVLPESIPLDILYEDQDIIVINKPPGMVVHPAAGNYQGTLVNALLAHCRDLSGIGGKLRPGIVHRLDKDTSGVLVAVKNDLAHKSLAAQLKERSVERWYLALAKGSFTADEGVIDAPIGRHPVRRKQMTVTENGRPARTWYYVRERFDGYTLVECRLETGRTHQVRVHLAYIRHPLVGDQVYGGRQDHLGMTRQALHAYHLGFRHPRTGEFLSFSAPLPADMAEVLERLRRGAVR